MRENVKQVGKTCRYRQRNKECLDFSAGRVTGSCDLFLALTQGDQDLMIATLDVRNRIRSRLAELGISASTLAGLIGLSDNTMSDFLRNKRSLGNDRESAMLKLLDSLVMYADAARPFKLPLDNVGVMRRLVEHFRKFGIEPEQVREYITALVGSEQ